MLYSPEAFCLATKWLICAHSSLAVATYGLVGYLGGRKSPVSKILHLCGRDCVRCNGNQPADRGREERREAKPQRGVPRAPQARRRDMVKPGTLIATLRKERGLAQHKLGELTGFSRDYVAGVEWTGHGSVAFYRACEKAFDLEEDALLQWTFLAKAELFAQRYGVSVERFAAGLQKALQGFRTHEGATPPPELAAELHGPEAAPSPEEAPGKVVRNQRRKRSLMLTQGRGKALISPRSFFCGADGRK